MSCHRTRLARIPLLIALAVSSAALAGPGRHALAAGSRLLTSADVGDFNLIEGADNNSIAGATYKDGILLVGNTAYLTILPHRFPGYTAFTAAVGVPDGSVNNHPGTAVLSVTVDGKLVRKIAKAYEQAATTLTVPFGQASQIKLTLHENQPATLNMLLGNPRVMSSAPKSAAPPALGSGGAGKTTLMLSSASVAAGGQETALITTGANAALTLVIGYPDGSQQVLGPRKAGADGHFAYGWIVPGGMAGIVRVVVVSSGIAQATFTIE